MAASPPSVTNEAQLSAFTLFPRLPSELQSLIWTFCRWPRVISTYLQPPLPPPGYSESGEEHPIFCGTLQVTPPAILQACSEARKVALQYYKLSFEAQFPRPIYFDSTIDSLYFPDHSISDDFYLGTLLYSIRQAKTTNKQHSEKAYRTTTAAFPDIEEIILIGYREVDWTEEKFIEEFQKLRRPEGAWPTPFVERADAWYNPDDVERRAKEFGMPKIVFWSQEKWENWSLGKL